MIRKLLRKSLAGAGISVEGRAARARRERAEAVVAELLMHPPVVDGPGAEAVVFSRDRAMQLHAFLGSWFACAIAPCPMTVLYTCTSAHEASYRELEALWNGRVAFVRETAFREDLIALVAAMRAPRAILFTDDGMFLDPFDLDEAVRWDPRTAIFALTKGRGLTRCFITDTAQRIPERIPGPEGAEELLCWRWRDGDPGDWSYPLSVDGHVLGRDELVAMLRALPFRNPNTLESELQAFAPYFLPRTGLCFPREKLVNIPANTVQSEWRNRDTGLHDTEQLLAHWNAGKRIEHEAFRALSCGEAETSSYRFVDRELRAPGT